MTIPRNVLFSNDNERFYKNLEYSFLYKTKRTAASAVLVLLLFNESVCFDQAVFAVFPTINDACSICFCIFKDEEVVSKHVHL
jgi:hypothetical protein